MRLIGVIGLPGCGKTSFFLEKEFEGFLKIDDIGIDWTSNEAKISAAIQNNQSVLVSDIEFCDAHKRAEFENHIGRQFEWICFENAPMKCAVNSLHRYYSGAARPHVEELEKIVRLSKIYQPFGEIRRVKVSGDALKRIL